MIGMSSLLNNKTTSATDIDPIFNQPSICVRENCSESKRKEGEGEERESVEFAAVLVDGERGEEGEEREAVEVVEEEELSIKMRQPESGGDLEPHCEQWCLPTLLLPACKQGNHNIPLSATISPRPHTVQAFPSNTSASVEQQTPNSLPHSNPVSFTPLSSVHLFNTALHKKCDELVTGVNIPFCLGERTQSKPTYKYVSTEQNQDTIPFHSLASPSQISAIPQNLFSSLHHDEHSNDTSFKWRGS